MRPLEGVRVLDLSRLLPGPFGSLVLADLGAQVDKVEDAGSGDYLRHMPPQRAGASIAFHALNRGKRSAIIDLKKPEGVYAFERLLGHYDVLFEQFRPGVLERLGLGHDRLRAKYPPLIICALTGYGQNGPLASRAGHDLNYLARSGILGAHGPADGPPQVAGFQLADVSGGMWCAIAILAALRKRDQSGEGEFCDIAMTDGVLGFATMSLTAALAGEAGSRGDESLSGGLAPYNTYLSKDGAVITLCSLEPKFWMAFCAATGLTAEMSALLPGPHQEQLKQTVAEVFRSKTRSEWEAFAEEHDCCVEPMVELREVGQDANLRARGLLFEQQVDGTSVPQFRTPVTPASTDFSPAPKSGEHTREIFTEAGFSEEEIDALYRHEAIGPKS